MEKQKRSNIVIVLLIVIILILSLLVVLLATGTINFNGNNTTIGEQVKKSIKIDDSLDYVYDASYTYDNKYNEFDRWSHNEENTTNKISNFGIEVEYTEGMQYLSNLKVPYININTEEVKKINKELESLYLEHAKTFDKCAEEANSSLVEPSCSQILTYKIYNYNDILSVVVINSYQATSKWILDYNIYNFDLTTGKLLKYNDLLTKLNYDKETTLLNTKILLKNKLDELYGPYVDDLAKDCRKWYDNGDYEEINCYDKANELLEKSINDNSILFFVNNVGNLNILAVAYYDGVQNGEINKYLLEIKNS